MSTMRDLTVRGMRMNQTETRIRVYQKPRSRSPDRVLRKPLTALLVGGVVNPFGPTLTAVVAAGQCAVGASLPVICLTLNEPFARLKEVTHEKVPACPEVL
jgi:hypothetical protein